MQTAKIELSARGRRHLKEGQELCLPARLEPGAAMRPVKRSFTIAGHRTSISLEVAFWDALKEAAAEERLPVSQLIARIDAQRGASGLSSAVRVWILARCRARVSAP